MSALASILPLQQSDPNNSGTKELSPNAISGISVTTRIEYNLRFTKQAVLVVSNNTEQYSQLASQYLVSLSNSALESNTNQINVAFVSASAKLNDIQIRCRLVEQLFVNTLFDPEQSLAVSVLKFAKQHGEAITIVVDHAHALSLQIKYELSHLVNQSKKHKLKVNVVIFGLTAAANQLSVNKSLFKNKMAVIDAKTGQIINLDDNKLKPQNSKNSLTILQKFSLVSIILIVGILLTWGYQLIRDDARNINAETKLGSTENGAVESKSIDSISYSTDKVIREMEKKEKLDVTENAIITKTKLEASSEEINVAILSTPLDSISRPVKEPIAANVADVINALALTINTGKSESTSSIINKEDNISPTAFSENSHVIKNVELKNIAINAPVKVDNYYYQNQVVVYDKGYVVQIAGFTDKELWKRFIREYPSQRLFSYQRLLKGESFIVVTSKVYPNKAAATEALILLPEALSNRNPWLKDISSVINEINTFKG